ncbi:MAG: hypothetical protein AAFO89_04485 [Planctomycetota bacterium]
MSTPLSAVLPDVATPNFIYSEFVYQRCERHNMRYASGEPVGFESLPMQIQFWPPHGIPDGPNSYHQPWMPLFAIGFTLLLMLIPPIDPAGTRRSITAILATLCLTLPLPYLASFLPKFWYTLTIGVPNTPIARIGVEPLGAWVTWSGVLTLYAVIYLKLRPLTAPREPTPDRCNACNYDLTNLDTCPECNTPRGVTPTRVKIRRRLLRIAPFALPLTLMCAPLWLTWIQAIR